MKALIFTILLAGVLPAQAQQTRMPTVISLTCSGDILGQSETLYTEFGDDWTSFSFLPDYNPPQFNIEVDHGTLPAAEGSLPYLEVTATTGTEVYTLQVLDQGETFPSGSNARVSFHLDDGSSVTNAPMDCEYY